MSSVDQVRRSIQCIVRCVSTDLRLGRLAVAHDGRGGLDLPLVDGALEALVADRREGGAREGRGEGRGGERIDETEVRQVVRPVLRRR